VLAAWRDSGLSLSAFASRQRIGQTRLQRWKTRLEGDAASSFHPVRLIFDSAARGDVAVAPSPAVGMELVLRNGRRIAVGAGFDPSVLEELTRVVESWGC
jgi:hypothetical protein